MSLRTPSALRRETEDFFDPIIHKRGEYATFINEALNDIILKNIQQFHMDDVPNKYPHLLNTYLSWIGGSRSWENWYSKLSPKPKLSTLERSSIAAGNYDVFFTTNHLQTSQQLACDVAELALRLKKELNKKLNERGDPFSVELETREVTSRKKDCYVDDPPSEGESFPGYAYLLYLTPKKKERTHRADRTVKSKDNKKLLVYLEIFYFENMDLKKFQDAYLRKNADNNLWYLSELGLFTFSHFIKVMRKEKGLSVDMYRQRILMNHLKTTMNISETDIFSNAAYYYKQIWEQSNVYDVEFMDRLHMNALKFRSPFFDALMSAYESWVIEAMRPSINTYISYVADKVNQIGDAKTFIVLVGGDAMRRYRNTVSVTKDIDTKIYINPEKVGTLKTKISHIIDESMSQLVYYLFINKLRVFGADNTFSKHKDPNHDISVTIDTVKNHPEHMQFRMRQIDRSEEFPVTLYSIDYRCYIRVKADGRDIIIKHDIPILDVVLQENEQNYDRGDVVKLKGGLPVASLDFLLKDIVRTYRNFDMAAMRFWGRKRDKDRMRFEELKKIYLGQADADGSVQSKGLHSKDTLFGDYLQSGDITHKSYECAFKALRTKNRRSGFAKHKLPFDWNKVMARYGKDCQAKVKAKQTEQSDWNAKNKKTNKTATTKIAAKTAKTKSNVSQMDIDE